MDEIVNVFLSWQFLLVGIAVFFVFAFFNGLGAWKGLGAYLWKIKGLRKILQILEGIKMLFPPLFGFGMGWIPQIPRPEPLVESTQFTVALLYMVAGLCSPWIVKGIKKALEAKGINVDIDLTPKEQKKHKIG